MGSWLLEVILHANRVLGSDLRVTALSRDPLRARKALPHLFDDTSVRCIAGDVRDFALPEEPFDICMHVAADVADTTLAAQYRDVFDTAVRGTQRVLDLAQRSGVRRFLFTSSGAVYGPQPAAIERMPESCLNAPDPLEVSSAYGQGKRAAEWLVAERAASGAGCFAIARIYALLGPRLPLNGTFAAGNFIRDALAGAPLTIRGDGTPLRCYLYMADACVWLLRMMSRDTPVFACNVGAEQVVSIAGLAALIEEISGAQGGVHIAEQAQRRAPLQRYVPDTTLARQAHRSESDVPARSIA